MMYSRASTSEDTSKSDDQTSISLEMPIRIEKQSLVNSENTKLTLSLLYCLLCGLVCAYSVSFGNDRMPTNQQPLRDIMFEITEPQYWALTVAEIILLSQGFVTAVILAVHKNVRTILKRFFFNFGTLYLLRAFCLISTTLTFPGGNMKCQHSESYYQHIENFMKVYVSAGLTLFSTSGGFCGNYFFSGHTITITLQYLVIQDYTPKCFYLLRKLSTAVSFIAGLFLIISRGHYTIDVIAAYYITTRIWWNYHAIAWNISNRNPRTFPPAREIWYPIIYYLEENTGLNQETNELRFGNKPNSCSRLSNRR